MGAEEKNTAPSPPHRYILDLPFSVALSLVPDPAHPAVPGARKAEADGMEGFDWEEWGESLGRRLVREAILPQVKAILPLCVRMEVRGTVTLGNGVTVTGDPASSPPGAALIPPPFVLQSPPPSSEAVPVPLPIGSNLDYVIGLCAAFLHAAHEATRTRNPSLPPLPWDTAWEWVREVCMDFLAQEIERKVLASLEEELREAEEE